MWRGSAVRSTSVVVRDWWWWPHWLLRLLVLLLERHSLLGALDSIHIPMEAEEVGERHEA